MNIVVLYSSRFGQTLKIAHALQSQWQQASCKVDLFNIEQTPTLDWDAYDVIVIGASIRYGHYAKAVHRFIDTHTEILNQKPSYFYSVSILAAKAEKSTFATHPYTQKLFANCSWQPQHIAIFAGELAYRKYHIVDKYLMKLVMSFNKNVSSDVQEMEFTDWEKVKQLGELVVQP
ncbi:MULTISPECIES: menaquinone-dependent protoporphyrinogen IX dehydrogenase [Vitreoscilla]|uniref:Menaquinone-dependent protoporphyrinogen IX dehydrogenase n=1 Tax=Vitreoscilla stercoraria TaxID=61 RepID=A0ABY4ECU1_VITST|nr:MULTISPECIES: menaquinone-dependent protoporphyrinogen IX dehydrogenase [Vitreoscilla]AUZ05102.2 flavodoxin domain-containing protein [Vitreoscilla sp. C1]UOO93541.1 menaquinone-dependent protoporphyrinogen IX dehydrogenase [Vitreoscilla stercoraria]